MEENRLALIIKEKTLGKLVTNARDIQAFVAEKLKSYSVDDYKGDEKQAAKDKAELNAAAKKLNDERIKIEKEWNAPFAEFKDIVKETTTMITSASAKLDAIVKAKEEQEKQAKKEEIKKYWGSKNFDLVSFDRIFNSKWLNKTYKMAVVYTDIDSVIASITADLAALNAFGEDTSSLKEIYLTTLNLQAALQKGAELKANRERLHLMEENRKAEAERKAKEEQEKQKEAESTPEMPVEKEPAIEDKKAEQEPEQKQKTEQFYMFNVTGSVDVMNMLESFCRSENMCIVPALTIRATADDIARIKNEFTNNNLKYKKNTVLQLNVR